MADWSNPLITTQYDVFVNEAKDRDVDCATMFLNATTNTPVGAIRYNRGSNALEEYNGSTWVAKIISVSGGGTGSGTAAGAVAGLGLGTMSMQNSNAVSITGGSVQAGTIFATANLGIGGPVTLVADNAYDLGTNALRFRKGYFRDGFVIPVGVDKYATS